MKDSYKIKVPVCEKKYLNIKISYKKDSNTNKINYYENIILNFYKNKIDKYENNKRWDNFKKLSNDYELIHISNFKNRVNSSIAFYIPLSRSYFKLWEIIVDYNLLNFKYDITTAHIAEGPGGFVEAVVNYRKKNNFFNDQLNGITLKSSEKEIPGWRKSEKFLKNNPNVNICYGKDGTGNIYNLDNILFFTNKIGKNSCEFITADGGFDFSVDFNKQEQLSYQLIFCQIVIALSIQKKGGSFVCKIFDSYSPLTIKLLWLLNITYESIIISKPLTSRPANSEKYIIAHNFIGINDYYLNHLYIVVDKLYKNKSLEFYDLFSSKTPYSFNKIIENFNNYILYNQLKNIIKTINLINKEKDNKGIDDEINDNYLNENIINMQVKNAIQWCLKYNIQINYKSKYLKPKDKYFINNYLKSKNTQVSYNGKLFKTNSTIPVN